MNERSLRLVTTPRMGRYFRPDSLAEALSVLADARPVILAGGTDFYPARVGRAANEDILDITRLGELRGIRRAEGGTRLGALTTWAEIAATTLPPQFRGLQLAAREVGGEQIQNAGTVAGNLCNASPAADGVPPLLALSAEVEIASAGGRRTLPLAQFIRGSRKTALAEGELVTAIVVPDPLGAARSTFLKLGARRYLVISIAMVSAVLDVSPEGLIRRCGIAVGSCSAVARRLPALEFALVGQPLSPVLPDIAEPAHLEPLTPITDVRGTADYRAEAALALVRRALRELVDE